MQVGMLTPAARAIFLAFALAIVVACTGDSEEPGPGDGGAVPGIQTATPALTATPVPTATPVQIVGVRGAAQLDNPVFPSLGNGGYDVSHYDLDLDIDPGANTLDGVATMTVIATANLLAFNFDFAGPAVSAVEVNDEPAAFTREGLELTIEPANVIPDGSEFTVRIIYGGTPELLLLPDFPIAMGWTPFGESVMVHGFGLAWFPINQTPSDKATYTMRITVPQSLTATATGELTAAIRSGDTSTYVWEVTVPVGGVAFAVSNSELDSIPGPDGLNINNYFPSGSPEALKERFDIVPEVIELFNELFGPFPYDSFGITFLRGPLPFDGFSPSQRAFLLSTGDRLIVHEIAHQWFGASVTPILPSDNWLAEGFATYAELLWIEHTSTRDLSDDAARRMRVGISNTTRPPAIANSGAEVLDRAAYIRGGLTLHALRLELGDDDFFDVLRTYAERFRHSAASTADFISVAEEVSQQDLGQFFDDWVYSRPVPPLD
ncbi:MAG: M1 family metallopeptidase [Chloroflexi bacterium]|nr:M1 family metallopeptidase [Chloroflexota bacterium]